MKNKSLIKIMLLMTATILSVNVCVFSQGINWRLIGNNNVGINDWIGSQNNADFIIKTNNQTRIKVGKDGTTEFFGNVKMTMNSLNH